MEPSAEPPSPPAPQPASTRPSSSATPTRIRLSRQRRPQSRRKHRNRPRPRARRHGRLQPAPHRRHHDLPRRLRQQRLPRRQRHPRRLHGLSPAPPPSPSASPSIATSAASTPALLPTPMMNIINGGAHADNNVDFQEFMIMPGRRRNLLRSPPLGRRGLPHPQESVLKKKGYNTAVGDEGGFAPSLKSNDEAIDVILEAISARRLRAAGDADCHRPRPRLPPSSSPSRLRQIRLQKVRSSPRSSPPNEMVDFY